MTSVSNEPGAINGGVRGERQAYVPVSEERLRDMVDLLGTDTFAGIIRTAEFRVPELRSVFTELLALRSQSPETSSSEPVADYWAVHSVSGAHIGLWADKMGALGALAHYPNGKLTPLYLEAPTVSPAMEQGEVEVVATAWRFLGSRHVDFQFEPDALSIERGQLTDIEPLVRLSDYQALEAEHDRLNTECQLSMATIADERRRAETAEARLSAVEGALKPLLDEIGLAEWATPEGAEEILRCIIRDHYGRAREALTAITGGENER